MTKTKADDSKNGFTGLFSHGTQARIISLLLDAEKPMNLNKIALGVGSNNDNAKRFLRDLVARQVVIVTEPAVEKRGGMLYEIGGSEIVEHLRRVHEITRERPTIATVEVPSAV